MAVNFIRWNATSHIYELSTNDGSSFSALPLDAAVINEGALAKARQHAQTAYLDAANIFSLNQLITKTRPELQLLTTGATAKTRLFEHVAAASIFSNNLSFDGTNWNLDDVSKAGSLIDIAAGDFNFFTATAGANPRTVFNQFILSNAGLLTLTAGQLKFPATQNPSADANTLDDYEEGDWTPAIQFGGAAVGMTYSLQLGSYIKIGRLIICCGIIILTAKGSSTGNALITGLPFVIGNNNKFFSSVKFNYTGFTAGVLSPGYQTIINSSTLNTVKDATGVNTIMTHADYTNGATLTLFFGFMTD